MYTYEMIGIADENGKTYTSQYGSYNKETGFVLNDHSNTRLKSISQLINNLFHENCWSLDKPVITMTKEEIEKELGYKINIVSNKLNYKMADDDLFSFLFK